MGLSSSYQGKIPCRYASSKRAGSRSPPTANKPSSAWWGGGNSSWVLSIYTGMKRKGLHTLGSMGLRYHGAVVYAPGGGSAPNKRTRLVLGGTCRVSKHGAKSG